MGTIIVSLLLIWIIYLIIFKILLPNNGFDIGKIDKKFKSFSSYVDFYILQKDLDDLETEVDKLKNKIKRLAFKSKKRFKAQQRKRKKRKYGIK